MTNERFFAVERKVSRQRQSERTRKSLSEGPAAKIAPRPLLCTYARPRRVGVICFRPSLPALLFCTVLRLLPPPPRPPHSPPPRQLFLCLACIFKKQLPNEARSNGQRPHRQIFLVAPLQPPVPSNFVASSRNRHRVARLLFLRGAVPLASRPVDIPVNSG